ncbi:MAG: hypothetical protein WBD24_00765 [Candidatus Omnitrophota bacterium]
MVNLVDRLRALHGSMIGLHIFSKVLIGFGLGVVFAKHLAGLGWWIVLLGVVLSVPPIYLMLKK